MLTMLHFSLLEVLLYFYISNHNALSMIRQTKAIIIFKNHFDPEDLSSAGLQNSMI